MTRYKLLVNPAAEQDLRDAKDWYNLQQESLGDEFVTEVDKIMIRICENPLQFPKEKKQIRKAVLKRFPYSIFFYTDAAIINVFAVFHASRNPNTWKKRLD